LEELAWKVLRGVSYYKCYFYLGMECMSWGGALGGFLLYT
jgi:hypothetical protein